MAAALVSPSLFARSILGGKEGWEREERFCEFPRGQCYGIENAAQCCTVACFSACSTWNIRKSKITKWIMLTETHIYSFLALRKDGIEKSAFVNFPADIVMESKMLLNALLLPASQHA